MKTDWLLWSYMITSTLLIIHEIDSGYWREWDLFRLPGGIGGFLLIHVPMLLIILHGLVEISRFEPAGRWYALALSMGGIIAFLIHMYFLRKGRREFKTPVSITVLGVLFLSSLALLAVTMNEGILRSF